MKVGYQPLLSLVLRHSFITSKGIKGEALTDQHSPHGNEDKETNISTFLQREENGIDMVWKTLRPPVQRVKSVTRKRRRYGPFMVWFMKPAVYEWMVQASMYPIDPTICEEDE